MEIEEFREKIKPGQALLIENKEFSVREVVKFKLDDGSFYFKCHLDGNYAFADDIDENIFILVKKIDVPFQLPFPQKLVFDNKDFEYLCTAHGVADEVWGEQVYPKGYSEHFWDYKSADGSYLSLGVNDSNSEREDFYGKIIAVEEASIK